MLAAILLASGFGRLTTLPMEPGLRVREVLVLDIDRNQKSELVVGVHDKQSGERRLEEWVRSSDSHVRGPRGSITVPEDAIAFAYASLGAPARDLIVFTSRAAWIHDAAANEEAERWKRLFNIELLWAVPDPERIFHIQPCVQDLDGNGIDEFVLPDQRSWSLHRRDPKGLWVSSRHELPPTRSEDPYFRAEIRHEDRPSQRFTRIGRRRDELPRFSNWISLRSSVPGFVLADIDGDGRRDLGALSSDTFSWWRQGSGAELSADAVRETYPLASAELRVVDLTRSVRIQDLNGDGRADVLAFAAGNLEKNQTQALIWIGSEENGKPVVFPGGKKPSQALILDGLAQAVALRDIDGNGLPDLIVRALKPDLIDILRSAATQRIDLQMHIFLNQKGVLSRRPDFSWTESTQAGFSTALFELIGDITGDGFTEAVIRSTEDKARVVSFRKGRDGRLSMLEKPLWEGDMAKRLLLVPSAVGPDSPDIFWYGEEGVTCLNLR
jgi:hypothetical protein